MESNINKAYTSASMISKIKGAFLENKEFPSVMLQKFLCPEIAQKICKEVATTPLKVDQKPIEYTVKKGTLTSHIFNTVASDEIKKFLSSIIGKEVKELKGDIYALGWKNYALMPDADQPGYDVIIDCTESWPEHAGGSIVYKKPDGTFFPIPVTNNTLTIVKKKKGVARFFQYVNHYGKGKEHRFLLLEAKVKE